MHKRRPGVRALIQGSLAWALSPHFNQPSRGPYHLTGYDAWLFFLAQSWKSLPCRKVGSSNGLNCYQISDLRFFWPENASVNALSYIYDEVFMQDRFNPHAYEWGPVRIRPGDWVIDAGACEGFFAVFALERRARVCLVEPVPELAVALRLSMAQYAAFQTVVVPGLLGRSSGQAVIAKNPDHLSTTTVSDTLDGEQVDAWALDDLVASGRLPRLDYLKSDVEGGELDVLVGATQAILNFKPRIALAVYHSEDQANEILEYCRLNFPEYRWHWRGMYTWDDCIPRPYMLYGWPPRV